MSKADGKYLKIMARILKNNLIILDDFGLEKLKDVSHWHNIIGEPTIAEAILDRVVYNSIGVNTPRLCRGIGRDSGLGPRFTLGY